MPAPPRRRRNLLRDQRGQSLIIVVLAMTVFLGVAALAIDVALWYQKDHQAQVAADAGALAAANCMANSGTTTSCQTVGSNYVSTNGASGTISWVPTTGTPTAVQATATIQASGLFSTRFWITSSTRTKEAVASWKQGETACSTPGNSCAAVFAMSSSCTDSSSGSPIVLNGSGDTITGAVHSNGTIDEVGGSQALGQTTFGNGSGCLVETNGSTGDTWDGSATKPSTGEATISTWPDDYSKVLTACGGSGEPSCTGPGGTPSYCTEAAANFTFGNGATAISSGNVWCAYGSGHPYDPSSWNGLIEFQSCNPSCGSSSSPWYGTWMGGTIDLDHDGWYLSDQTSTPTYPTLYAIGSGTCSSSTSGGICMPGQRQTINGGLFSPNGEIQFNGAGSITDNFVEGLYVNFVGGSMNIVGDGPQNIESGTSGGDWLIG